MDPEHLFCCEILWILDPQSLFCRETMEILEPTFLLNRGILEILDLDLFCGGSRDPGSLIFVFSWDTGILHLG